MIFTAEMVKVQHIFMESAFTEQLWLVFQGSLCDVHTGKPEEIGVMVAPHSYDNKAFVSGDRDYPFGWIFV